MFLLKLLQAKATNWEMWMMKPWGVWSVWRVWAAYMQARVLAASARSCCRDLKQRAGAASPGLADTARTPSRPHGDPRRPRHPGEQRGLPAWTRDTDPPV